MPIGIGEAMLGSAAIGGLTDLFNLRQQKKTQETTWEREDNAQQRAVADLKAAGLSPTLAAGHGAPSGSTEAPRMGTNAIDNARTALDMFSNRAQISKTMADTQFQQAQAKKAEMEAELMGKMLPHRMKYDPLMLYYEKGTKKADWLTSSHKEQQELQKYYDMVYDYNWRKKHNLPMSTGLGNYGTVAAMLGVDSYASMIKDINQMIEGSLRRLNPFKVNN